MARLKLLAAAALLLSASPADARLFPDSPFSDQAVGTTAAQFLKTPPSARADALGGAFVSAAEGAEALFWNPAGAASLETTLRSDLSAGYDALLETAYLGSVAYARPVPGVGVLSAGFLYSSQSGQQGYDGVGDPAEPFTPNDLAFAFGYAKQLDRIHLGAAAKLVRSQVAGASGMTFALDLGVQRLAAVNTTEGPIDLGLAIQNLGPAMSIGNGSDPLPLRFQLGARWHLSERIAGLLDGFLPVDDSPYVALGLEGRFPLGERLRASARGGYNISRSRGIDGLTGMAGGFGIEFLSYRLDYAWVPFGDLGSTNRVTFGIAF
ncbi:MAG: PorV/PorQ family protein [Elusimicrobia bacterium]|nr:PorV/PorQ family protein [Elusimicrobiota bacterium]